MNNDQKIWKDFIEGDKSALSYVYFQNFEPMYQYGMKFKSDPEFIRDCIQDVFHKIIQAGKLLSPDSNIRFYLFKALKNRIYKEFEKEKRLKFVQLDISEFNTSFICENNENSDLNSYEKALSNALKSLSQRQREAIYLRYECGMEYEQICQLMDLKNDSARKLIHRSIKCLKEIIENEAPVTLLFLIRAMNRHVVEHI